MATTITNHPFLEIDGQDGRLDGHLTPEQLSELDPSFRQKLDQLQLLGADGSLPYAQYLDTFGYALPFWEGITDQPHNIPLLDALHLGKKMRDLRQTLPIRFWQPLGGRHAALNRLKTPSELFVEMVREPLGAIYGEPGVPIDLVERIMHRSGSDFIRFLTGSSRHLDPQILFRKAARAYLAKLVESGQIQKGDRIYPIIQDGIDTIDVYEKPSQTQQEEDLWLVSAALAYKGTYFFPKMEGRIWGEAIRGVNLTYVPLQRGFLFELLTLERNPFEVDGYKRWVHGTYDVHEKRLALPMHGIQQDIRDPASFKGDDVLNHELGHGMWKHAYTRSLGEWFKDWFGDYSVKERLEGIAEFFADLTKEEYHAVFGTTYGHPDENGGLSDYDPIEETHSALLSLAEQGYDFPEQTRKYLEHSIDSPDRIKKIVAQLTKFRAILEKDLGFHGHPLWANRYHK